MTIEQRLLHDHGVTTEPVLAVWMLRDGTMINGSYCGRQRDVDHHEIGQYFKRSKFQDPGSSAIYIKKFMRRGNIRYGCSSCAFCIELAVTPSQAQFDRICEHMLHAWRNRLQTCVGRPGKNGVIYGTFWEYIGHIRRYTDLCIPEDVEYEL